MSDVSNLVLRVATRIVLIKVKEQGYFHWLVQDELFCIGPYPLHGVVWHSFTLCRLLEPIPMHVTLVIFYVLQLLCNLSFTFLSLI